MSPHFCAFALFRQLSLTLSFATLFITLTPGPNFWGHYTAPLTLNTRVGVFTLLQRALYGLSPYHYEFRGYADGDFGRRVGFNVDTDRGVNALDFLL